MPIQPQMGRVHTATALTNVAISWRNDEYVATQTVPEVSVKFESDVYNKWNKADIFRDSAAIVGVSGEAPRGGFDLDAAETYTIKVYKFAWELPDRVVENMDSVVRAGVRASEQCMDKILLAQERVAAALKSDSSTWSTVTAYDCTGAEWDSAGGGDPVKAFRTMRGRVRLSIGREINQVEMSWEVVEALLENQQIIDRINGGATVGNPAVADLNTLARVLRVPKIIVYRALYNSAGKGKTAVIAPIMGKTVWMGWVAPGASIFDPSAVYCFVKNRGVRVRVWREDSKEQDVVEAQKGFDMKATSTDAGGLITNCIL